MNLLSGLASALLPTVTQTIGDVGKGLLNSLGNKINPPPPPQVETIKPN